MIGVGSGSTVANGIYYGGHEYSGDDDAGDHDVVDEGLDQLLDLLEHKS